MTDLIPAWVLIDRLLSSPLWEQHVSQVRQADPTADVLAKRYIWRGPDARRAIAVLLRAGASAPPGLYSTQAVLGCATSAYWVDAPLEEGDPVYAPSDGAKLTLIEGAEAIACRGAGCCLGCRARLASKGRAHDYCGACETVSLAARVARNTRRVEAIRTLLNAAVPAILNDVPSRAAMRRSTRNRTPGASQTARTP